MQAWILPQRGDPKWRPAVVLTPTDLIDSREDLDVVGTTCSYYPDNPDYIPVDWNPDGRCITRFRRDTAISLTLVRRVSKEQIRTTEGRIGAASLIELLARLKERNLP